jgi:hypothetical protein
VSRNEKNDEYQAENDEKEGLFLRENAVFVRVFSCRCHTDMCKKHRRKLHKCKQFCGTVSEKSDKNAKC